MKTIRFAGTLIVLVALVLVAGTPTASAVTPTDNGGPGNASFVDNQVHSIAPNSVSWFRFNYQGDQSLVSLTMPNLAKSNLIFEVYTPGQIQQWWKVDPVGQGTDSGDDQFWQGASIEGGTYYVRVVNYEPSAMNFQLLMGGAGAFTQPTSVTPGIPVTGITNPNNTVPERALYVQNGQYSINANTSRWYRFSFPSDDSKIVLTMPNGKNNGLTFEVYGADQIGFWWKTDPAGRGNVSGDDLNWVSSGDAWTTFYVRVINDTGSPVNYNFTITGARGPF